VTQRKWTTEDGWEVLTGWDRPLQHFFVNIDRTCRACNGAGEIDEKLCQVCDESGTEYLFNNLSDTSGLTDKWGGMSIENVAHVLSTKLTHVPDNLMWDLMVDKSKNSGNEVKHYGTMGKEVGG
jgi:hypothetical protein